MQFSFDIFGIPITISEQLIQGLQAYAMAMVLLVVLIFITRWQGLDVTDKLLIGTLRGTIQIVIVASVLLAIFDIKNILLIYAMLVFMCLSAAYTARNNLDEIDGVATAALPGILVGGLLVMTLTIVMGIIPPIGEYIIPMGGMVIGNCMSLCSLLIERMHSDAQKQRGLLETALALGATPYEASETSIRDAMSSSIIPMLNRYAALGIVSIPGLMSGMIIGGQDPIYSALYQVIIFVMIFLGQVIAAEMTSRLFLKQIFNERMQITVAARSS
ncbi:iron export ABC transporter permease subunit FetB [Candidatus Thorarchaeota archaeon]|nr:MAG: iron export ABC transporter permease subunit FetB [Candidatus Thorarchaeota archaeon]